MDSLIRLRQLNKPDISGYITQVLFPALLTSGISVGGSILPSGSGIFDLGATGLPYRQIYAQALSLPTGSGIYFGNNFFTAYTSGGNAILKINSFTITSSPTGLSIIGPTGPTGPTGPSGATGLSGLSVTGAVVQSGNQLKLVFSDGRTGNAVSLPSGATGATGVSLTGLLVQSGNYIRPMFSNGTSGTPILLPSGTQGAQGLVGGINVDFSQFTGFATGDIPPAVTIYNIDPNSNNNPTINLIKGMSYQFGYSGINLSTVTVSGTGLGIATGIYQSNYFVESGITGYLKFILFDSGTLNTVLGNPSTGRFTRGENGFGNSAYSTLISEDVTSNAFTNINEANFRASLSFTTRLSAASSYKYGFQKYFLTNGLPIDNTSNWGFYVLGDVALSNFGPTGPQGLSGVQGVPGAQGERGAAGVGTPGVSITGIERNGNDIRFLLSDGTTTDYTTLPAGGVTGPTGPAGSTGPSGVTGPTGPQGSQGQSDRYYASFFPNDATLSGNIGFNKQVSGTSSWTLCTGTGRLFGPGDKVWTSIPALLGNAYSTSQQLVFSDANFSGTRYFYGTVNTFNKNNGEIQFTMTNTPNPAAGLVSGQIQWYNYNLFDLNLGGLGSSGPTGPTGPTGPPGDTGNSIFNISPLSGLVTLTDTYLDCVKYNAWNLYFVNAENRLYFDYSRFSTGETVLIKIKNSGVLTNDNEPKLIYWDANAIFPYGVSAPAPNPGFTNIYTFVRFPDVSGSPRIFSTYSVNYGV